MSDTPVRRIRIPDELWTQATDTAKARGENVSVVVRRLLTEYVEENS